MLTIYAERCTPCAASIAGYRDFEVFLEEKLTGQEIIDLRHYLDYLRDGECNLCEGKILSIVDTMDN